MNHFSKPNRVYKILFHKTAILFFLFNLSFGVAQTDSIHLHSGETIIGELIEMKRNLAIISTDFSENDIEIKWNNIKNLKTQTLFLISTSTGQRYNGYLESIDDKTVIVIGEDATSQKARIENIVYLRQVKNTFLSKVDASLSVGYNFTKAKNLSQYSVRSNLGYKADRWLATTRYNQIISTQDDIEKTQRLDANLVYNYFLKKNWFLLGEVNWLSNTAQNINLRTLGKSGIGRYLIQSNSMYWGLQSGISFNNESFNTETGNISNNSTEAFFGTEVNLYDVGDFHLLSRVVVYPSLTESGRWRSDFNLDIKYDLPLDFFINLGFSLNYDNQPIQTGVETDYIFQTTIGWSL